MKQDLSQAQEKVVCPLELSLIGTREQLEVNQQKVKELQSVLWDKENEISFLKEVLSARTTLVYHQVNTIVAMQEKLKLLMEKDKPPVIAMKAYLPEREEPGAETAS